MARFYIPSEDEQVEWLKDFYQAWALWIWISLAVVLGLPAGWQVWSWWRDSVHEAQTSLVTEWLDAAAELTEEETAPPPEEEETLPEEEEADLADEEALGEDVPEEVELTLDERWDELFAQGREEADSELNATRAVQLYMVLAAQHSRRGSKEDAIELLRIASERADSLLVPGKLTELTYLQLSRALLANDELEEVMSLLQEVDGDEFIAVKAEMLGDLAAKRGDIAVARTHWQTALEEGFDEDDSSFASDYLRLKISSWQVLDMPIPEPEEEDASDDEGVPEQVPASALDTDRSSLPFAEPLPGQDFDFSLQDDFDAGFELDGEQPSSAADPGS